MAMKALNLGVTTKFVSVNDPSRTVKQVPVDPKDPSKGTKEEVKIAEGATYFVLKPLDVFLRGWIFDNSSDVTGRGGSAEVGIKTKVNQTNLLAVRHSLLAFENFTDDKGNALTVTTKKVSINDRDYTIADDATMEKLGLGLIQELAAKVHEISEVTAAEAKN